MDIPTAIETTLSRHLKALGFRKLSARQRHHAQNEAAITSRRSSGSRRWPSKLPILGFVGLMLP